MTYTPPPAGPPPAAAAQPSGADRTQLFGILGIVLAFCCPLVGIIFAGLSIWQAGKFNGSKTLGYIGIGIGILAALGWGVFNFNR